MAVESSKDGGTGAAGEFLKRTEMEAKKEREMGGDFEHIACRDGDDYDSNETEGSFVMVKRCADSDGKSDSSEREIELDVGSGVGDPPDVSGAQPSFTSWSSSNERVDEGNIEKEVGREGKWGKEVGKEERKVGNSSYSVEEEKSEEMPDGGNQVQTAEAMHLTRKEIIVDSTRADHELKEEDKEIGEILTNDGKQQQKEVLASKDSMGNIIEDLSEEEKLTKVDLSKNKEQNLLEEDVMVVEDSKGKEDEVSEVFNDEKEAVAGIEEQASEGTEASYVQNETGIFCDGPTIRVDSSPVTSSDAVDAEHESNSVLEEREDVDSSITQSGNKDFEAVFENEERKKMIGDGSGDAESFVTGKKEVDSAPEYIERRDTNDELGKDFVASITDPGKEEVNNIYDFEDKRKMDDDEESKGAVFLITEPLERGFISNYVIESKDAKDDGSKEAEASITDHVEQVGSPSPDGVKKIANDNKINCADVGNESKSVIQENENKQIKYPQIDSDSVHSDLWSSAEQVQQGENASLAKPASEEKEDNSFIELIAQPVKGNIGSSSLVEQYQVVETPTIVPIPISIDKAVNLVPRIDDKNAESFSNINQQNKDSPTDSDCVDRDYRSSFEQMQQPNVDTSLPISDSEAKELNLSIESASKPVEQKNGSSSIFEDYQVVEVSSICQSPESVNQDVDLDSRAENKHLEALSIESHQSKTSPTVTDSMNRKLTQDVNASPPKSGSEEKEHESSLELIAESVKENSGTSSIVEQYMVSEASSVDQSPVSVNEGLNKAFLAEDEAEAMFTANQPIIKSPIDSDFVDRGSTLCVEQAQQQDADISLSKSDSDEKDHDSSLELNDGSVNENIGASSMVEQYTVAEAPSIGSVSVNDGANLASLTEDKPDIMPIANHQINNPPTDSEGVGRDLMSYVEQVQQQEVDVSLTKSDNGEKEYDSSSKSSTEPVKENIVSSSLFEESQVAEVISNGQIPDSVNADVNLSADNVDRNLEPPVERLQQHYADASFSKSAIEEKESDSCIELIAEQVKASTDLSFILENFKVAEVSSFGQSAENVKESVNLSSRVEDKHVEDLSIEGNMVPFKEKLILTAEAEENQNDKVSSIYLNTEPKEMIGLASNAEGEQVVDVSFIDPKPEPIQMHLASTSRVEESHIADVDVRTKPIVEDVGSVSKTEEITVLETQPAEDRIRTENLQIGPTSVKEHGSVDVVAVGNQKRELESATVIEEPLEIHLEKDMGVIKEQQVDLKSEKKQAAVHIKQYQGSSAPSTLDGDGEKAELHTKKHYIIKIPRFAPRVFDNELQQKLHEAQMKVDKETHSRDFIMVELENMRKVLSDLCHKRDSSIEEEKKARTLLNAKRQEMDSLQSVISKGKIAASFLDIASQIHTLTHKMQHETISLKEEKKCLHDLNQLKFEQEHHLFNKSSKLEIDEALRQKETAESSLKTLKKDFDLLRSAHLKADEFSKAASKSYANQFSKVKEHEKKWRTANELRQNAYKDFNDLKSDKMDHFWKCLDDRQAARKYASSRDIDALERHCTEQIERILQLWNEDEDFRKQYVESNVNSTLRRFGTLDGRSVGVNEAIALPSRVPPPSTNRSLAARVKVRVEQPESAQEISRPALQIKKMARSKPPSKPTSIKSAPAIVPVKEEIVEAEVERKLSEEKVQAKLEEELKRQEEEWERKEEELRKEKEAMDLKEKIRMEQKAKAKEAEERKRRKSEKARARADYKVQKAAELKEQKRAKKEKKKEDFPETTESMEGENSSVPEISSHEASQEPERTSKRSSRQSAVALNKYSNRAQPVPLPLRNKGKRKTSMLVWSLCGAAAVGGLVFAGNYISFSGISFLDFSF